MRLVFLLLLALTSIGCGGSPAHSPSRLRASDVIEVAALPPGYEAGDTLRESCSGRGGFRAIDNESLNDVDCSAERLSRSLRARAAERHSLYLVEKSCRVRGTERVRVSCRASLVEATSSLSLGGERAPITGPAPSPGQVADLDEPRPQDSAHIRVSFAPRADEKAARRWRARAYDRVAETAQPAVGRRALGELSARCLRCDEPALHHALRVTAGRVGAGEVSAVRCFAEDGDTRCVATALEPWSY